MRVEEQDPQQREQIREFVNFVFAEKEPVLFALGYRVGFDDDPDDDADIGGEAG